MTQPATPPRPTQPAASHRARNALWLALTIPLAAVLSYFPLVISIINLCGISGCSGGGYGVVYGPVLVSMGLNVLIGAFFFAAIGLVPWAGPRTRLLTGGAVGGVIALILSVGQLMDRYS